MFEFQLAVFTKRCCNFWSFNVTRFSAFPKKKNLNIQNRLALIDLKAAKLIFVTKPAKNCVLEERNCITSTNPLSETKICGLLTDLTRFVDTINWTHYFIWTALAWLKVNLPLRYCLILFSVMSLLCYVLFLKVYLNFNP